MPTNVPDFQTIDASEIEGTDWVYVSRRDETSRVLKNKGVVYGEWYIPFAEFVEAVAAALVAADGFGDVVDAVVAELDNYVEPTWTTI